MQIQRLCIFCGSSFGSRLHYEQVDRQLGTPLAQQGIEVAGWA